MCSSRRKQNKKKGFQSDNSDRTPTGHRYNCVYLKKLNTPNKKKNPFHYRPKYHFNPIHSRNISYELRVWTSPVSICNSFQCCTYVKRRLFNAINRIPTSFHSCQHFRYIYGASKDTIRGSKSYCVRMYVNTRLLWTNPGGYRGHGLPKSRWTDGLEDDTMKLGCRNWRADAQDRGRWRHLLKEAKAHPGL